MRNCYFDGLWLLWNKFDDIFSNNKFREEEKILSETVPQGKWKKTKRHTISLKMSKENNTRLKSKASEMMWVVTKSNHYTHWLSEVMKNILRSTKIVLIPSPTVSHITRNYKLTWCFKFARWNNLPSFLLRFFVLLQF